jgi:hypothetical protein
VQEGPAFPHQLIARRPAGWRTCAPLAVRTGRGQAGTGTAITVLSGVGNVQGKLIDLTGVRFGRLYVIDSRPRNATTSPLGSAAVTVDA